MAFTIGATVAYDGEEALIPGGLLSADIAGGGVGPTFMFHGIVDGKAGVNKLGIFAEDAAHTSGDTGLQLLTVRQDTAAALGTTDADYQPLVTDASGRLHVNVGAFSPGVAAGSLGKAEDAAHVTGDVGVMALAVHQTAQANFGADGDYTPLSVDGVGGLRVSIVNDPSIDDADFTAGTTRGTPIMGVFESSPTSVTDGDMGIAGLTATRALKVSSVNAGVFPVQIDGFALTALQLLDNPIFVDDAAFTPGASSVSMIGAEFDNAAVDSVDEGDAGALRMSANRNLFVNIRDAAGNERGLNIDASGQLAVTLAAAQTLGTLTALTGGGVAHDGAAAAAPPVLMGGYSSAAAPASVSTDVDAVRAWHLPNGAQATVLTAAGALIGGDAAQGLDVDVTRVIPGVAGDNLGKAEDAGHSTGHTGVMALAVRNDAITALATTDLDYIPFSTDSVGRLHVNVSGTAAGSIGKVIDVASGASDVGVPALVIRDDVLSALSPAEGDWVPLRTNSVGALHVKTTSTYAEDTAHASGDPGTMILGVRQDAVSVLATTDGDYLPFSMDASGYLRTAVVTLGGVTPEFGTGDATAALRTVTATDDPLYLFFTEDLDTESPIPIESHGFDVTAQPTVSVSSPAYVANDIMGGLLTFTVAAANDKKIMITGAQVAFKSAVMPNPLKLILFNADPTNTTKADSSAYSLNAADVFKVIETIDFQQRGAQHFDHGTPNTMSLDNLSIVCSPASGTSNIFGLLVDGSGVTLTSDSDVQIRLRGTGV